MKQAATYPNLSVRGQRPSQTMLRPQRKQQLFNLSEPSMAEAFTETPRQPAIRRRTRWLQEFCVPAANLCGQ
jgi:hypothetical protein